MERLTPQEQAVVNKCKIHGFGAYLQAEWFIRPHIIREARKGNFPTKDHLIETVNRMRNERNAFWFCYCLRLNELPVNPLVIEQQAWKAFMPVVDNFISSFKEYLETYSPEICQKQEILKRLGRLWFLLQVWNAISWSFKCKIEKMWDEADEREAQLKKIIGLIQSEAQKVPRGAE